VSALPGWLRATGDGGAILTLHVQPGAKTTDVAGEHGDALKIRLAAPPVDGKANAALLAYLAARLGIAKGAIRLKSGETSRRKCIEIVGLSAPDVALRLAG